MIELILHAVGRSRYNATVNDNITAKADTTPILTSCRFLSSQGESGPMIVRYAGSKMIAMRIPDIQAAALVAVTETDRAGPRFVKHRPFYHPSADAPEEHPSSLLRAQRGQIPASNQDSPSCDALVTQA